MNPRHYTLTRADAAKALTGAGYPTAAGTLENYASKQGIRRGGNGPPYIVIGNRAMYRRADLLAWAKARVKVRG